MTTRTATPCPLCDSTSIAFYGTRRGYDLFRCKTCRMIYISPMPVHVEEVYGADYFTGASEGHGYTDYEREKLAMISTFEEYLRRISVRAPKGGTLLDVGAATGTFVELANTAGFVAEGVELSAYAAAAAQVKGLKVKQGRLEDAGYPDNYFDVVTLFDVFEHITDPKALLAEAKRILKPGGLLVVNTVDADSLYARMLGKYWHLILPPEHLLYFSVKNFAAFVERNGFTPLETAKIGKSFPLPYVISMLSRWLSLGFLDRFARYSGKTVLQKIKLPIHLHDLFFMIAEKK